VLQQGGADVMLHIGSQGLGQIDPVQLGTQDTCNLANEHLFYFIVAQPLG
jgi:hypothetical protein